MGEKLRPKYIVQRIGDDGEVIGPVMRSTDPHDIDSPFVLMPRKDPAAYYALLNYAQVCETDLGNEIHAWLRRVVEAPAEYGTQGGRNRVAMKLRQMELFT